MPRSVPKVASRRRRKKLLKQTKGFRGGRGNLIKKARETLERSMRFSYRDRRNKKRDFRRLWIVRINAGARMHGLSYSKFMHGLKLANVEIDRKILAEMAVNDQETFAELVDLAKSNIAQ